MRLWHEDLIPQLPRQQLLGQHRECCALRGRGWGKKHSVVDYVFQYAIEKLEDYHFLVMKEMERRGYTPNTLWWLRGYRGKSYTNQVKFIDFIENDGSKVYLEHNQEYLKECLANLKAKGIELNWGSEA